MKFYLNQPFFAAVFDGHEKTTTNPNGSNSQEETVSESNADHISNKGWVFPTVIITYNWYYIVYNNNFQLLF